MPGQPNTKDIPLRMGPTEYASWHEMFTRQLDSEVACSLTQAAAFADEYIALVRPRTRDTNGHSTLD